MYNSRVLKAVEPEFSAATVDRCVATIMNKRNFIRLFGTVIAGPFLSRLFAHASETKLKNWAGNLEYSTDRLYSANSLEQVRNYVKKQRQLKVLGTRHCFNNIADSRHSFLSLKPMDEVVALDPAARTVTVDAGITYGQLCPVSPQQGFCAAQSGLVAPYFDCGSVQHRNARLGRKEWQPRDGGLCA